MRGRLSDQDWLFYTMNVGSRIRPDHPLRSHLMVPFPFSPRFRATEGIIDIVMNIRPLLTSHRGLNECGIRRSPGIAIPGLLSFHNRSRDQRLTPGR